MREVDKEPGWHWEVHTVSTAYRLPPAQVRQWGLWRVTEAAAHIILERALEAV